MFGKERERPFLSEFSDLKLLRQDGSLVPAGEALAGRRYILVYFSAHWCPPCQRFTPILTDFYNDHHENLNFEVLFVSVDKKESRMMDFFQNRSSNYVIRKKDASLPSSSSSRVANGSGSPLHLSAKQPVLSRVCETADGVYVNEGVGHSPTPATKNTMTLTNAGKTTRGISRTPIASGMGNWLALPFNETKVRQSLTRRFSANAIPTLIVLDADSGCVCTREGKTMVYRDENAQCFPWRFADAELARRRPKSKMLVWWQAALLAWMLAFIGYHFYCYYYNSLAHSG